MVGFDFIAMAQQCAPAVHYQTLASVVTTESTFNPFAIGVVGGRLERQPRTLDEAVATAKSLVAQSKNFSAGVGQVNRYNFARYGLTIVTAFDACQNLRAASAILIDCFDKASRGSHRGQQANLKSALSCYYSGNFTTGFKEGYVARVVNNAAAMKFKLMGVPD